MENKKFYDSKLILTLIMAVFFGFALMFTGCSLFGSNKSDEEMLTETYNYFNGAASITYTDDSESWSGGPTGAIFSSKIILKFAKVKVEENKVIHVGENKSTELGLTDGTFDYLLYRKDSTLTVKCGINRNSTTNYCAVEIKYSGDELKSVMVYMPSEKVSCEHFVDTNKVRVKSMTDQEAQSMNLSLSVVSGTPDVVVE